MTGLPMLTRRKLIIASAVGGACLGRPFIARAATPLTLRLDWVAGADHAGIYLAQDRGFYAQEGLDLTVYEGKGSVATLQSVASGNDTIGVANLSTMALAAGTGAKLTAIAAILQKAPDGLIALASSNITKPKDLEGKTWGFVSTDSGERMFPAFARATQLDVSTIKRVQLQHSASYTSLILGNVDFISGWAIADALKVGAMKPVASPIVYADYGVNTLGNGFFVAADSLSSRADTLKAFMRATIKGYLAAEADPQAGVAALIKARPSSNRTVAEKEILLMKNYLHTDSTQGKEFGWMSDGDWARTVSLMQECCKLPSGIDPKSLYTNAMLPPA